MTDPAPPDPDVLRRFRAQLLAFFCDELESIKDKSNGKKLPNGAVKKIVDTAHAVGCTWLDNAKLYNELCRRTKAKNNSEQDAVQGMLLLGKRARPVSPEMPATPTTVTETPATATTVAETPATATTDAETPATATAEAETPTTTEDETPATTETETPATAEAETPATATENANEATATDDVMLTVDTPTAATEECDDQCDIPVDSMNATDEDADDATSVPAIPTLASNNNDDDSIKVTEPPRKRTKAGKLDNRNPGGRPKGTTDDAKRDLKKRMEGEGFVCDN